MSKTGKRGPYGKKQRNWVGSQNHEDIVEHLRANTKRRKFQVSR